MMRGVLSSLRVGQVERVAIPLTEREVFDRDQSARRAEKNQASERGDADIWREAFNRQVGGSRRVAERCAHRQVRASFGDAADRLFPPIEVIAPSAMDVSEGQEPQYSDDISDMLESTTAEFPDDSKESEQLVELGVYEGAEDVFVDYFRSAPRELDMVYRVQLCEQVDHDVFIVIEAKGGAGKYTSKEVHAGEVAVQGTKAYLKKTIDEMLGQGTHYWVSELKDALHRDHVKYFGVEVKFRNTADYRKVSSSKKTPRVLPNTMVVRRFV